MARDEKLQSMGRHLQRTKKGGAEVAARRWKLARSVGSEDDSSGDLDGIFKDGFVYASSNEDLEQRRR